MDREIFKNHTDYWQVSDNIRNIYMSNGSLTTLLDFERVLDEVDIYAFKNWEIGELVAGPEIGKYRVTCHHVLRNCGLLNKKLEHCHLYSQMGRMVTDRKVC